MAGLLYYLPGREGAVRLADVAAAGLGYAFEVCPAGRDVHSGPDGGNGTVIGTDAGKVGYYPDKQVWMETVDGRLSIVDCKANPDRNRQSPWLGFYADDRPAPAELLRSDALAGHMVTLGDGNKWQIPVARQATWSGEELRYRQVLPQHIGIDREGKWTMGTIVPRYAKLWDAACAYWDAMMGAMVRDEPGVKAVATLDFTGELDAALLGLSSNYRVGKDEVAALGLFTPQCIAEVLGALVDMPTILEWLKKNRCSPPAGSNTGNG